MHMFEAQNGLTVANVAALFENPAVSEVQVTLNQRMYSVKKDLPSNWVWHAFRGYKLLHDKYRRDSFIPETFASIGTGSGIDAIGASMIFDTLRKIIITDVEPDVVRTATENVRRNVKKSIEVVGLSGDVCTPLLDHGISADIIYANLPNITTSEGDIIDHGTFYLPIEQEQNNDAINSHLLSLQLSFLQSAKSVLTNQGEVAFMIGGRFSLDVFDVLAATAGFNLREVLAAFKVQTEAENVTAGYSDWEHDDVSFEFYDYQAASDLIGNRNHLGGRELKNIISPSAMSATSAFKHVQQGMPVGHTLHMLAGRPQ